VSDPAYRYVQLITILPGHSSLFRETQTPLSRINLRQRLKLLEAEDRLVLHQVSELLDWHRHHIERSDAEIVQLAKTLIPGFTNPFVRELIEWRLEARTLVAAMRRRRQGQEAPGPKVAWGYGRWLQMIRRHWHEPHFGLEKVFPWLVEAREHLDNGNPFALERLLLGMFWERLDRLSEGHEFDFEAVLIYVMRWDLVARWVGYQAEDAARRFNEMVDTALQGFDRESLAA
jgi:hypothetical protein